MQNAETASVDLRSDTVTRPTAAMRAAMAEAPVGDVCWNDDPTVNRLEAMMAERLGKEAAIFVPSGTMGNQLGVAVNTSRADAVLLEATAHIAHWEVGGASCHLGVQLVTVAAEDGLPTVETLEAAMLPSHYRAARMALLALENTHNSAGGVAHPPEAIRERAQWARSRGLSVHMDGARLFNAAVACGVDVDAFAREVDSVSVCLSKGLGAPVGSIFAANRERVEEANRARHRLGGGWRQAGILAAAGLHAVEHHVALLADDHARAKRLAAGLRDCGAAEPLAEPMTNILYYRIDPAWGSAEDFTQALAERGVLVGPTGPQTGRMVTHLDVDDAGIDRALAALTEL